MSIIDVEEEERKNIRPQLRLITGGKGPPEPPRRFFKHNWLSELGEGAIFLAVDRTGKSEIKWVANEYHLKIKAEHCSFVGLQKWDPAKQGYIKLYTWVVNEDFSNDWECVEILDDGEYYRAFHDGRLVASQETASGTGRLDQLDQEAGPENPR